jgi:hypothetical protein
MTDAVQRIETPCGGRSTSMNVKWLPAVQKWENPGAPFRSLKHRGKMRWSTIWQRRGTPWSSEALARGPLSPAALSMVRFAFPHIGALGGTI